MELSLEYIAGLFDGEGSVGIIHRKPTRSSAAGQWTLQLNISNTFPDPIIAIHYRFGGVLYPVPPTGKTNRTLYRWHVTCNKAGIFCKAIVPFLLIKKEQVELAIEFQSLLESRINNRNGLQGCIPLTEEEISLRHSYKQRISDLNHKEHPFDITLVSGRL